MSISTQNKKGSSWLTISLSRWSVVAGLFIHHINIFDCIIGFTTEERSMNGPTKVNQANGASPPVQHLTRSAGGNPQFRTVVSPI